MVNIIKQKRVRGGEGLYGSQKVGIIKLLHKGTPNMFIRCLSINEQTKIFSEQKVVFRFRNGRVADRILEYRCTTRQ